MESERTNCSCKGVKSFPKREVSNDRRKEGGSFFGGAT